jgi:hypothetical protein
MPQRVPCQQHFRRSVRQDDQFAACRSRAKCARDRPSRISPMHSSKNSTTVPSLVASSTNWQLAEHSGCEVARGESSRQRTSLPERKLCIPCGATAFISRAAET